MKYGLILGACVYIDSAYVAPSVLASVLASVLVLGIRGNVCKVMHENKKNIFIWNFFLSLVHFASFFGKDMLFFPFCFFSKH